MSNNFLLADQVVWSQATLENGNSPAIGVDVYKVAAFQLVWTGTAGGTIKLQKSCDGENWIDVTDASQALGGSAGTGMFEIADHAYKYARLNYASTSGSGTFTVRMNAKG